MNDTIDRVLTKQIAAICASPYEYKGVVYEPVSLYVSPLLLRDFVCPSHCGACCIRVSLDWFTKLKPSITNVIERTIVVSGEDYKIYSYIPEKNDKARYCDFLNMENGRCTIYGQHPFGCDFDWIKFATHKDGYIIRTTYYGRSWAMKRIDGNKGALCYPETKEPSKKSLTTVNRKLNELEQVALYFKIPTKIPIIRKYIDNGMLIRNTEPILIK